MDGVENLYHGGSRSLQDRFDTPDRGPARGEARQRSTQLQMSAQCRRGGDDSASWVA
jgi:hypothetical protein